MDSLFWMVVFPPVRTIIELLEGGGRAIKLDVKFLE